MFLEQLRWDQGEHITCIGPTNAGKTTLALELMHHRASLSDAWHGAVICTKPRDRTMTTVARRREWTQVAAWPPPWGTRLTVFWPKWRGRADDHKQRAAIRDALDDMFRRGNLALLVDELGYLCRKLGLANDLRDWWQQGRSVGLSLIGSTQRPAWVPLDLYSAPRHLFMWRTTDRDDLRRIAGIGGLDTEPIRAAVAALPEHHVLYIDSRTGRMVRTLVDRRITP